MSSMSQNPCERSIAAMPAGSKRLAQRSSIFSSCSVRFLTNSLISSENAWGGSMKSEVVFDYMEPPQAFSEEMRELVRKRTEQLEKMDERWASRFEPAGMAAMLRSHGFCDIEDIDFQEITSRFGRTVQGLAPGQAGLHVVHAKH